MTVECRSLTTNAIPEGGCLALDDGCIIGLSGAGPRAAQRCSSTLIEAGATAIISWGCAAALSPRINCGDLILPTRIICTDGMHIAVDGDWHSRLASTLETSLPVYSGLLVESDRIVAHKDEKGAIFNASGAIALDMESAAAARVAQRSGLPFLAIRSIIDPADVTLPPSIHAAFDENGMLNVPNMLFRSLTHPVDFIGIIRLGRHFGIAMKTLRLAAEICRKSNFGIA